MYVSAPMLIGLAGLYMMASVAGALAVAMVAFRRIAALREENARLRARLGLPEAVEDDLPFRPERICARALLPALALVAALAFAPGDASAQSANAADAENAALYCRNIADAAADARFARQQQALAAMEKEIEARIAQLEAKRAEYQDWLQRRETFLKKADDSLIAVMSQMRPDAAAAQMSAMHEDMAAAVLAKLTPRVASAIMNEIEPARAARLTSTMVGMVRRQDGRPQEGRSQEGRPSASPAPQDVRTQNARQPDGRPG